jgi:hypothetical protein
VEPFEQQHVERDAAARNDARRRTLARAVHVWVMLPSSEMRWMPGVMSEWRHTQDAGWRGLVAYALLSWDPREQLWTSSLVREWATQERIRLAELPKAPPGRPNTPGQSAPAGPEARRSPQGEQRR